MKTQSFPGRVVLLLAYLAFTLAPIYWMAHMSLRTNEAITSAFAWFPESLSLANYATIFTDASWYDGYINSIIYVVLNTLLSVTIALPAAYAFSRYSFLGDKHLFFWLLTNRMTPPAVFLLPFFQLYTAVGLMDTHLAVALAHMVFNVPLAVWILEGFMSGVPREIDETAYIDGYSFPRFFVRLFLPLIKAGIGVTAFFCFMFSWVELLLARTLTSVDAKPIAATMTRTVSAAGMDWGTLAAAGVLTIVPGALVIYFVRHYIAKGFAMGRVLMDVLSWMAWTQPVALFFAGIVVLLIVMTVWEVRSPTVARKGLLPLVTTRGDRLFIGLLIAAYINLGWTGLTDLTQWWAVGISAVTLAAVMRWG